MNTCRLDLNRFFFSLKNDIYCIVKMSDFPNYVPGSDIDVFCYDVEGIAQKILVAGKHYIFKGFEIATERLHQGRQIHIDFMFDGKIEFRFDLYASLPHYRNISIKESYFDSVIENRASKEVVYQESVYPIFIPCVTDDLMIRYIEYAEWFSQIPDKIGHVNYILDRQSVDPCAISFLEKLHHYIKLPECNDSGIPDRKLKRPRKAIIRRNIFRNLPERALLSLRKRFLDFIQRLTSNK